MALYFYLDLRVVLITFRRMMQGMQRRGNQSARKSVADTGCDSMVDYYQFFASCINNFVERLINAVELGLRVYRYLFRTCWVTAFDSFRAMMKGRSPLILL